MKKSSKLKSTLVAVGGSLAAMPAAALELGDIKVHSTLGQPLRASIAYALGPNEALADTCVTLLPMRDAGGLPSISRASLIVTDGIIAITGNRVVREPLMSMRLSISCPYTARLTRDYMMFIDPAGSQVSQPAATAETPVAQPVRPQAISPPPRTAQPTVRRQPVSVAPIAAATRYQVRPGDSLSLIAQRIENRPVGLWDAVEAIFAANPDAFIDSDPNKLKAGSWLSIPSFGATEPVTLADTTEVVAAPAATGVPGTAYEPALPAASDAAPVRTAEVPAETQAEAITAPAPNEALADLEPGDVILDVEGTFEDGAAPLSAESVVIPDTELDGPATTSSSPNVPAATIRPTAPAEPSTTNWLVWFGGGGLAIVLGLLLFGRNFRDRFGSTPIAPATPQRRRSDTGEFEAVANPEFEAEMDMLIDDDSPTEENLALDADLVVGTGLQQGTDVDVAQDFGFAATTDLDIELTEAMADSEEQPETDMIPPMRTDQESILDSEVLPDDDDYDMSVIVDATQVPDSNEVTEKDLEAVQVSGSDETLITDDYTVSQEADYKILEQDYEDELTATQALNAEIAKAAEELAERMDADIDDDDTARNERPLATVHELDVTAQLTSGDEHTLEDDDDTGVNPTVEMDNEDKTVEMGAEDKTVEMTAEDKTVEMAAEDKTVEVAAGEGDETAEMEIESGKVDTKAG